MRSRLSGSPDLAWGVGVALLALLIRLPFLFGHHSPPPGTDGEFFLSAAVSIRSGDGFLGDFWTPGYPAFIDVASVLPGRDPDAVTIVQHLLGAGVAGAVFVITARWWGRAPAIVAGAIAGLAPTLVVHEHTILPDFLFGVLVLAGAVALAEACARDEEIWRPLVLAAVLFGLAAWVKPAGQFLFLAAPLPLFFARRSWRGALLGSLTVAGAMLVVISPWLLRNAHERGYPTLSVQGGATLFNRAFEVSRLPIPPGERHTALARAVWARTDAQPGARFHSTFHKALLARGVHDSDAWVEQKQMAQAAIRRSPGTYLADSADRMWINLGDVRLFQDAGPLLDELDRTDPPYPTGLTRASWHLARVVVTLWWILTLHGVLALLVVFAGESHSRRAGAALLSVWLAISVGTALTHGGLWRYSIQVVPLAWILGSAGIALAVRGVTSRLRGSRPPVGSPA